MKISRHYTVDEYTRLTFAEESDWSKAIEILRDRFETRYLGHVRALLGETQCCLSSGKM